ncbi:D-2-hydroxyacid dehydrogenase [Micromonospora sp. DR5-3]|uniref:D-2-hydroxyacid dehydrogenase n=1 Tax=unclassified Micromonospora TaxID=2617518 RepID=UPI0011D64480|nr:MULTISPECIES: D-2-hydroxyacid dehydrogenase [unclassified Micromonospora]MCW3818894.1 D-2-hydroxyacid dehydrogenase [Micromonospora sp. DR5-3]TYC18193.1 D-2-hydroxyacid dehydrogenase [Micromonospora sp. MP36]
MADRRHHLLVAQPVDPSGLKRVRALLPGAEIICRDPLAPGTTLPAAEIADCTIVFADHIPANIDAMRALRWIQLGSAGYQQLNGLGLGAGVRVSNASGVNDVPIAEWCVLMMLSFARGFPDMLRDQRGRTWSRDVRYQAELRGRRVGIFGYGSIGHEVARLSRSLGLEVWALSRRFDPRADRDEVPSGAVAAASLPDRCFSPGELHDFLQHLDFLVIAASLNHDTVGRFGTKELGWLPNSAVVLNPARAHIIDEAALLEALRDGTIAGAALDSHYREPMPQGDPFWSVPNAVVTPHISGSTGSTFFLPRLWELFTRNLDRFLSGDSLLNEVPPQELVNAWNPARRDRGPR